VFVEHLEPGGPSALLTIKAMTQMRLTNTGRDEPDG